MTSQTEITIRNTIKGWTAKFGGKTDMPVGIELPLPFTSAAPREVVLLGLARRFPLATIYTAAA